MPQFKGNEGNLMQHWVLCELINSVRNHFTHLTYVDAHSMAPIANTRTSNNPKFDVVFKALPGRESLYEQTWNELSLGPGTYPNSANFVQRLWRLSGSCTMLLCEKDDEAVSLLRSWASQISGLDIKIANEDWRNRFRKGLPKPSGLMFISFDPNIYDRNGPPKQPRPENMYPTDLKLVLDTVNELNGEILIQISTYSANNGNPQDKVAASLDNLLKEGRFTRAARIKTDGNMMSLVYTRDVVWAGKLKSLSDRFDNWFGRLKR